MNHFTPDPNVTRIFDLLDRAKQYFQKSDFLAVKRNDTWEKFSTEKYIQLTNYFSAGLLELGFKKGDKIVTVSNNCPEWNIMDIGMMQVGVVHVPVYQTLSLNEFRYILNHSEPKMVIISGGELFERYSTIVDSISSIEYLISIDLIEKIKNFQEIIDIGKATIKTQKENIQKIKAEINTGDLASIIYTSGTTGISKGVMLSHRNLITNAIVGSRRQKMNNKHKILSFLPLCHVYERMNIYQFQYLGISIYYAENITTIAENLKEINAEGFNTVPRLIEKVYDKIIAKGRELPKFSKMIFYWAVNTGLKYELNKNLLYKLKLFIARKLVFKKWKAALGGNIMFIGCGGAVLQTRLEKIFRAAEMPIHYLSP